MRDRIATVTHVDGHGLVTVDVREGRFRFTSLMDEDSALDDAGRAILRDLDVGDVVSYRWVDRPMVCGMADIAVVSRRPRSVVRPTELEW